MMFIFCMQINLEVLCKVILSFWVVLTRHAQSTRFLQDDSIAWVCVARRAQSTKNNQFTKSLQYQKENMVEVDFLAADKC